MPLFPWNEIPDSDNLPAGYWGFTLISIEQGWTQDGRLKYNVQLRLREDNPDFAGRIHFESFTIGTEDDPDPERYDSKVFGVKRLKWMFKAMALAPSEDPDQLLLDCVGKNFDAKVRISPETESFAARSQIQDFFPEKSKELGSTGPSPVEFSRSRQQSNQAEGGVGEVNTRSRRSPAPNLGEEDIPF